jgi:hypothetical protein
MLGFFKRLAKKDHNVNSVLSPSVDSNSTCNYTPGLQGPIALSRLAKAEGLTDTDAMILATWLRSAGYQSIQVVRHGERASVLWSK